VPINKTYACPTTGDPDQQEGGSPTSKRHADLWNEKVAATKYAEDVQGRLKKGHRHQRPAAAG
jgi:hypothetical protein